MGKADPVHRDTSRTSPHLRGSASARTGIPSVNLTEVHSNPKENPMKSTHLLGTLLVSAAGLGLVACGGGDSTTATETTITGSAVKGPVNGATVTARKADGTACGSTTTSNGTYTLKTTCTGDLIIEVSGGSYTDEATGAATTLSSPLKVVIAANGGSVTGVATPLTTMAFSTAFSSSSAATKAAFDTQAARIATQFGLSGVNLATTEPTVTGTANDYGKALKAVSQYLKDNPTQTLATITNADFKNSLSAFGTAYSAAFKSINGTTVTMNFDGSVFTIGGTGSGGGSGTCGVTVTGTVTAQGFTVPLNLSYCVKGLQGTCDSGNSALSQSVTGQGGVTGAANLQYSYSATCPAGAVTINIAS